MWEYNFSTDNDELYHHGVKGMRWGVRNKNMSSGSSSSRSKVDKNSEEYKAKVAKRKKALKIGAAATGTVLAAYGTYKAAKYIKNRRETAASKKAQDYINDRFFKKVGETRFKDGTTVFDYTYGNGTKNYASTKGMGSNAVGRANARVVAEARRMQREATNTRLDRGLNRIVNAGDRVGNTSRRAASAVGNTSRRAASAVGNSVRRTRNRVLDTVNPIYETVPGQVRTRVSPWTNVVDSSGKVIGTKRNWQSSQDYYTVRRRRG